jgi:hypothetical protein
MTIRREEKIKQSEHALDKRKHSTHPRWDQSPWPSAIKCQVEGAVPRARDVEWISQSCKLDLIRPRKQLRYR